MNHAKKPAWPPPFPSTEWSEAAEAELAEATTAHANAADIQGVCAHVRQRFVLCFMETGDEESPIGIVHGLENKAEETFTSFDPSHTSVAINRLSGALRQELASRMVWEYVWEKETSARAEDMDSSDDHDATHRGEAWVDDAERTDDIRYTHTDDRFTPFLEKFPQLRLLYEFVVRGALPEQ